MTLPTIETYDNYSSDNYGAHALRVTMADTTVWFSYTTPVAFQVNGQPIVVRENEWGPTTGKHLNWIEANKSKRVSGKEFARLYAEQVEKAAVPA